MPKDDRQDSSAITFKNDDPSNGEALEHAEDGVGQRVSRTACGDARDCCC